MCVCRVGGGATVEKIRNTLPWKGYPIKLGCIVCIMAAPVTVISRQLNRTLVSLLWDTRENTRQWRR